MPPGAESRAVITAGAAKAADAAGVGTVNPTGWSMPETIAVILAALWLLGLVSSHMMGGYIHILLAIAAVVVVIRVIQEEALEPSDLL
jgi:hypothetical protein